MPIQTDRLDAVVAALRNELIELLTELVRAQSVNPPGDTRDVVTVAAAHAATFPGACRILAKDEAKPNLLLTLGDNRDGGGPSLLFNSHLDTVPAGEPANWTHPPFSADIEAGRLFGRGCADAKASSAAMLMALKAVARLGVKLRGAVHLALVSDEEVGGACGTRFLLEEGLLDPDMVVIGEITGNRVAVTEKGIVYFTITTHGRSAHGSTPWDGISAISKMAGLLACLQSGLQELLATRRHPLVPPPSFDVSMIEGGIKRNVVADRCSVVINRRYLPNESLDEVVAEVRSMVGQFVADDGEVRASVEVENPARPFETSADEAIVRCAQHACAGFGVASAPIGYEQASDGWFFADRGIPTIILGPGVAGVAHSPDEHIVLEEVVTAVKIYTAVILEILAD